MRTNIPVSCAITAALAAASALYADADLQGLGVGTGATSVAVSGDGSVVVGRVPTASGPSGEAFRWTAGEGVAGIGDLAGGPFYSSGVAVSHDGSVVVGTSLGAAGFEAFRWTAAGGMVGLGMLGGGGSEGFAVSADGLVAVGGSSGEAFQWTAGGGMIGLGDLPPCCGSLASGVSADGLIVVGTGDPVHSAAEAFRWTSPGGLIGIGQGDGVNSEANAVSADGSVIVGLSSNVAVRWTESGTEMGELGTLPGGTIYSEASAVSADGSIIVGYATTPGNQSVPFIWDAANGMRNLADVLVNDLGVDLAGWTLHFAWGISADGSTIVGTGNSAAGNEAWIATLGATTDPADLDGDGVVGISDFLTLLANWGPCPAPPAGCPADIDGDGNVGINDMLTLLASWG